MSAPPLADVASQLLLQVEATLEQLDAIEGGRLGEPVEGLIQLLFDRVAGPFAPRRGFRGVDRVKRSVAPCRPVVLATADGFDDSGHRPAGSRRGDPA